MDDFLLMCEIFAAFGMLVFLFVSIIGDSPKNKEQRVKEEQRREVPRFPVMTTWDRLYHDLCECFGQYRYDYGDLRLVVQHYYDLAEANDSDALVPYWVTQIFDNLLECLNNMGLKSLNWLQFREYMKLWLDCSDEELEIVWQTYVKFNRVNDLEARVPLLMICIFYDNVEKHQRGIDVFSEKYLNAPQ